MTTDPVGKLRRMSPDAGQSVAAPEVVQLVEALAQGTATASDRDRLEVLLRDPVHRQGYLAACRLHSELLWRWHRGRIELPGRWKIGGGVARHDDVRRQQQVGGSVPAGTGRAGRSAAAFAAVAEWVRCEVMALAKPLPLAILIAWAVLAAGLGVMASLSLPQSSNQPFGPARPVLALITGLHQPKWRSAERAVGLIESLFAGSTLDLESGLVEIRYDCGASVLVEGPAMVEIDSASSARLFHGRLTVRVEKPAGGQVGDVPSRLFSVHTPQASVHDLGTEFGVEVGEPGGANVHVFDGLVELAAVAPVTPEVPVRLGAGEAVGIDAAGRIKRRAGSLARPFVRALPRPKAEPDQPFLERIGWNEAAAQVLCRESFRGAGPLAGTTPASRGGVGGETWTAPAAWIVDPSATVLLAAGPGTAVLPFRPEPGWLYRISIDLDVFAGGHDWFAVGLSPALPPNASIADSTAAHAWMGQRHETQQSGFEGNFAFSGPGMQGLIMPTDRVTGRQRRSILLDTRGRTWTAFFLLGDAPVARCSYPAPFTTTHIALSQLGKAQTRVHAFSVARLAPVTPAENKEISR